MSTTSSRRVVSRTEARFFVEGARVEEGAFWQRVEEIAREGYVARITPEEVRWTLTPKGREQGAGR